MALHYILDGYNIVKNLAALADRKLEDGRGGLVELISRHRPQGSLNNNVTIVFDGQAQMGGGFYQQSGIRIIFSSSRSADDKIKELIDQAKLPKTCVVVTNDREIQYYVRAAGAQVMTVENFTGRLKPDYLRVKKVVAAEDKQISKFTELKINEEMQDIWLKRKRATE
jgi:predicted RNA-binding protein with PIN domain